MSKIQVNDIVNHFDDGAPNFPKGIVVGSGATLGFNVGTGASIYSPSDNVLTLGTNNSERLRISSDGDVGVGNNNPTYKVSVKDTKADGTGVQMHLWNNSVDNTAGNVWSGIRFTGSTGDYETAEIKGWRVHPGTNLNSLSINTGGVERMVLSSSGVGIGTNAPRGKLEVSDGTSNTAGEAINEAYIVGATTGNSEGILTIQSNNAMASDKGGSIAFGGRAVTGSSAGANWAFINGYKENGTTANYGGYLSFATRPNTGSISERMRIDSSGKIRTPAGSSTRIGIDDQISAGNGGNLLITAGSAHGSGNSAGDLILATSRGVSSGPTGVIKFGYSDGVNGLNLDGSGEWMRLDSSGRLLIGTSSSRDKFFGSLGAALQVEGSTTPFCSLAITRNGATGDSSKLVLAHARGTANQILLNDDAIGDISWQGADGSKFCQAASIRAFVDGTPGTNNMPGRIEFSTNGGTVNPTQRMRIGSNGYVYYGNQTHVNPAASGVAGLTIRPDPLFSIAATSNSCMNVGRNTNDGTLINFYQAGSAEGSISVSGSTVSYNGAHLSRWSQLPSGAERTEILRGSVLSNLDEMCEWGEEDNEQLNRMQLSNVEGDKNVSGVFQAWDDDDDTYVNDFYCAMTGDFVIRIAQGTTVARGDLLMSAGDGTAKPQDDDIIRSKTIAKVTSTNVSETYEDGSYCVPCVLMAC